MVAEKTEDSDRVTDVRSGDGSTKCSYESLNSILMHMPKAYDTTCDDIVQPQAYYCYCLEVIW